MVLDSTRLNYAGTCQYHIVLTSLPVSIDALSTYLGVFKHGLPELGRMPELLFSLTGPYGLLVAVYRLHSKQLGEYVLLTAVAGPWIMGWHNIAVLLQVTGIG